MDDHDRYNRQKLLAPIGDDGQELLRGSTILIAGCGALGTVTADLLARAGVGTLVIVDRDVVDYSNLQRQTLFTERDAQNSVPKAEAAKARLSLINSEVKVRAFVEEIAPDTIHDLAEDCDLIVDGLDNYPTRYLLNDYSVAEGIPYIYGGAVATGGMSMSILPRGDKRRRIQWDDDLSTPCLRCLFPSPPAAGGADTCDTVGVLGTVTATIAAHMVTQAIKLCSANARSVDRSLTSIDVWENDYRRMDVSNACDESCPCCAMRTYEYLNFEPNQGTTVLCGRNSVQIRPSMSPAFNFDRVCDRLVEHGDFKATGNTLKGVLHEERSPSLEPVEFIVFPDGRAIITGDTDPVWARTMYDRFIGS